MESTPIKATAAAPEKLESIKIEGDGTPTGTKITINGKEVQNVTHVSYHSYSDKSYPSYSLSYTVQEGEARAGEIVAQTSYRLVPITCRPTSCCATEKAVASESVGLAIEQCETPKEHLNRKLSDREIFASIGMPK